MPDSFSHDGINSNIRPENAATVIDTSPTGSGLTHEFSFSETPPLDPTAPTQNADRVRVEGAPGGPRDQVVIATSKAAPTVDIYLSDLE